MVAALNLRNPRVSPASVRLTGKSVGASSVDFDVKSEVRGDIRVPQAKQLGESVVVVSVGAQGDGRKMGPSGKIDSNSLH